MPPQGALRETRERLASLYRAKFVREERKRQANPQGGLLEFIRYFWSVLEPVDELVEGWPLECLCAHLEAITRGEIVNVNGEDRVLNRLLANVPPGFQKSMCVNIWWPAFEWGPMGMPHLRYIAFSYASELTERDNAKFRDLICSEAYKELWGHVFQVIGDPKAGKVRVTNNKTGFKFASSLLGVGTGERGHRVLCLAGEQSVLTEAGPIPIRDIVDQKLALSAWSFNEAKNRAELQPIVGWHRNPGRPLLRITTKSGASITCTHDHGIYTAKGLRLAALLGVGDRLLAPPQTAALPRRQIQVEMSPKASGTNAVDGGRTGFKLFSQLRKRLRAVIYPKAGGNLQNNFIGQVSRAITPRAMALGIRDVLGSRSVLKIVKRWVGAISVFVSDLLSCWTRANKSLHHHLMWEGVGAFALSTERDARVALIHEAGVHHTTLHLHRRTVAAHNATWQTDHGSETGNLIEALESNNWTPFFDPIVSVVPLHDVPQFTYCLTVQAHHNLFCEALAKNCDDIHRVKGTQETSEARLATTTWVREAMQNRLNDLERDAIVVIMQRLHEDDTSGVILEHLADDYAFLCVPMEYERGRHFSHYTGWNNGQDPRKVDGDLAWPERYPAHVLKSFKKNDYLWAGQYMQRPSPRGGGIFKDDFWMPYEVPPDGNYDFTPIFTLASLDTAFKESEENDYNALTIWSVYDHSKTGRRYVMMVDAWHKRLPLHGKNIERLPEEIPQPGDTEADRRRCEQRYQRRASKHWGLCEWVTFSCSKRHVDLLVIEDSARGTDLNNEIKRLYMNEKWGVILEPVGGDTWSKGHAVVDIFTDEMVWAPGQWVGEEWQWRDWAQEVMTEMGTFPRGAHDDYVVSVIQALRYLRKTGWLIRREERQVLERELQTYKKPLAALYPV